MRKKQSNNKFRKQGSSSRKTTKQKSVDNWEHSEAENLRSTSNDPSWYGTDPSLLRDSASIPFSWATGTPIDLGGLYTTPYNVPGICTITLRPSVGVSTSASSPINVAATQIYSFVRHANSGSRNYDPPDLMLYLLGMGSVYSYITWLQRIYSTATLYSQRNRYMPSTLLNAQGVSTSSVQQNLADFRYGINVLINKAAAMAVPANMTYFRRMAFLYQNIYTEGTSIKDQLYMYVPSGFFRYSLDDKPAGQLNVWPINNIGGQNISGYLTVQNLLDYGNEMLAPLLASEDIGIISGDILKAYGEGNILKLTSLPEIAPIVPVFDIGVLEQMKNALVLPSSDTTWTGGITQDSTVGFLQSSNTLMCTSGDAANQCRILTANQFLTTTTADTSPELVMESTRLKCTVTPTGTPSSTSASFAINSGSEIAVKATYWQYQPSMTAINNINHQTVMLLIPTSSVTGGMVPRLNLHSIMENFDFHPYSSWAYVNALDIATSPTVTNYGIATDLDNYAVLTSQDIERMHEAAFLNMLQVPSIGKLR